MTPDQYIVLTMCTIIVWLGLGAFFLMTVMLFVGQDHWRVQWFRTGTALQKLMVVLLWPVFLIAITVVDWIKHGK